MKYEKFNPEDVIIEQGEVTNGKMYMVYSGELNVLTKNLDWYTKQNLAIHGGGNEEHLRTTNHESQKGGKKGFKEAVIATIFTNRISSITTSKQLKRRGSEILKSQIQEKLNEVKSGEAASPRSSTNEISERPKVVIPERRKSIFNKLDD